MSTPIHPFQEAGHFHWSFVRRRFSPRGRRLSRRTRFQEARASAILGSLADALGTRQTSTTVAAALARLNFSPGNLDTVNQGDPAPATFSSSPASGNLNTLPSQVSSFFTNLPGTSKAKAAGQLSIRLTPTAIDLAPGEGKTLTVTLNPS